MISINAAGLHVSPLLKKASNESEQKHRVYINIYPLKGFL